ncbi:MAG: PAS domain S-box protein [Ignavibacteria bacterium]
MIKRKFLYVVFLISALVIFCKPDIYAQEDISFNKISVEQGLSHSSVFSITQDSQGYLWFGTQEGLNKYYGFDISVYYHNPGDNSTLSSSSISYLYEDSGKNLWIGTWGGGLDKFDRSTGNFIRYENLSSKASSLSNNRISYILETKDNNLYIGTGGGGFCRFDYKSGIFRTYNSSNSGLSHDRVWALAEDKKGNLWIATDNGLNKFNLKTESITVYKNKAGGHNSLSFNRMRNVFVDHEGIVWAGTEKGLNRFDESSNTFRHFFHSNTDASSISMNIISTIFEDRSGNLWIGTYGGGLNLYNKARGTFKSYKYHAADPHSISSNDVRAIYQDLSGNMWIGTRGGGVCKFNMSANHFGLITSSVYNPNSVSSNNIRSVLEDSDGSIWIGTNDEGLSNVDTRTGRVTRYSYEGNGKNKLSNDLVMAIVKDREGYVWAGTDDGLNRFDSVTKSFTVYKNNVRDSLSLSHNQILSLAVDKQDNLWIGTYGGGLNLFDRKSGKFRHFLNNPGDLNSISANEVPSLLIDKSGAVWVGTSGGLNKFIPETNKFIRYKHDMTNVNSISDNIINSILEADGAIWIGTNTGLNRYDEQSRTFRHYTIEDGLPNNYICGIVRDDKGELWISTNKGLSCFDTKKQSFRNYNVLDGIQGNVFNPGSCNSGRSGKVYFGGINGLNVFDPDQITVNTSVPKILITGFRPFNRKIKLSDSNYYMNLISNGQNVKLRYNENFFTIEFVAIDYINPIKNQYMYKMEGVDIDWVKSGERRYATYTNLSPGSYKFRVKASNNDGYWNKEGITVHIRIFPPFWKTWWFVSLIAFIVAVAVYRLYQWRITEITSRHRELEILIKEKEKVAEELSITKERFEFAVRGSADGLWDWQIPTNEVYFSPQWKALLGFEDDELPNLLESFIERIYPAGRNATLFDFRKYLESGDRFDLSFRLKKKDGSYGWFRTRGKALRDENGKPLRFAGSMTDITLGKIAEAKLIESEERFRALIESASDVIFVVNDKADMILYASPSSERVLGYTIDELVGKSGMPIIHPDDIPKLIDSHIFTLNNPGEPFGIEYRIRHKNGEWKTFEAIGKNLLSVPGINGVVVNLRDITERKAAEEKLRNNENLFKIITSGVTDLIVILDLEGRRIYASDSYRKMFDAVSLAEGANSFAEIHPEDRERIENVFNQTIKSGVGQRGEYRFLLADGSIRYIESQGNIIFNDNGELYRVVVVSRDITDYKRAEAMLRENQLLLSSINQNITEAIYRIVPDKGLVYCNEAFLKMFGYDSPEEAFGNQSPFLYENPKDVELLSQQMAEKGFYHNIEVKFLNKNGTVFWGLVSAKAIYNDNGQVKYIDGAISNITYLKKTEREILELNKDLEKRINERTIQLKETNESLELQISVREKVERIQNAVYHVSESVHRSADLKTLCADIHAIINSLMPARNFYIAMCDTKSKTVNFPYIIDEFVTEIIPRKYKKGLTEYVIGTGQPLLVNEEIFNLLNQSGEVEATGNPAKIWLGVPLLINEKLLGVMALQDYENSNLYAENEKQTLTYISKQVAIALEKKQNEEAERKRIELVLENRNILIALAHLDEGKFEDALTIILNSTAKALNVERVGFWNLNRENKTLVCEKFLINSQDAAGNIVRGTIMEPTFGNKAYNYESLLKVLNSNRPVNVYDTALEIEKDVYQSYFLPNAVSSVLIVPAWFHNEVVGVVCLEHTGLNREFILEEEDFMSSIATMVSLAKESSNRRIAEANLKASEQHYKTVIDNANEAIIVVQGGKIKFANPRAIGITGFSHEELLSKIFLEFIHEDDRAKVMENYIRRLRGEDVPTNYSFRVICNDGSYRTIELNAILLEWQGAPATLNFLNDITDRSRAEEEIKKSLAKEKELNELRSRFISMTSHEFKTPLTIINSASEILERYSDKLTLEKRNKNLKLIQENVKHMTNLLNNVLFIGKTEANKLQLDRQTIDIRELCKNTVEQFELSTLEKGEHIIRFTERNLTANVSLDSKLIRQILDNLISNAIKYSPEGGEILFNAECSDDKIFFKVHDDGIGIPAADLKRLFEPFHRATNVGTISGTGLGLSIVKNSVELHGGTINVESEQNKGTTFYIELPLINS